MLRDALSFITLLALVLRASTIAPRLLFYTYRDAPEIVGMSSSEQVARKLWPMSFPYARATTRAFIEHVVSVGVLQ